MMDWFTFDKVKALIALCTFLAGVAGWFGFDGFQARTDAQATRKQMTTVVNYYYSEECKK